MDLPSRPLILACSITDRTTPMQERPPAGRDTWTVMRDAVSPLGRIWGSAWTLLVLGNLFWASNIIVGKVILGDVPAIALSFWRWTGAFMVAFWFAWPHLKNDWRVLLEHWKIMLALAATGIAAFNMAAYIGLSGTTALNVLLLQSSLPLIVAVWAFAIFKERPTAWQLGAILMSLAGVAFIAAHGSVNALLNLCFLSGDLWIMLSIIIYAAYVVLLRRRPGVHPLSFMQAAMGLGALMVAPAYLWELSRGIHMTDHWQNFTAIGYMAVFPSFISYLFFNRGVQLIGATRAGQSTHLMPIFGSVMAVLYLGESLRLYHFVSFILIGAGILIAHLKARPVRVSEETHSPAAIKTVRAAPE
jgi:drug/metabolite transporter (DMT)-like permease